MFEIREAREGDLPALYELYMHHLTQFPPEQPKPLDKWLEMFKEIENVDGYHLLVGTEDGVPVASVTLVVIKNLTHNLRPYALIENVVTHAEHRNKGHASALMYRASEIATACGCYKIMLMTGSKRESTLRFYERCGYNRDDKTGFIKRL